MLTNDNQLFAAGEIFESKNNSKAGKIYLGIDLNIGDKKILGTFSQNMDQIGTTFVPFSREVPNRDQIGITFVLFSREIPNRDQTIK